MVLEKLNKQLDASEDKFDFIGKTLAYKLRELPQETAVVTEKLINDIIFEATIGNINKYTKVNIYDSRQGPSNQQMPVTTYYEQFDFQNL